MNDVPGRLIEVVEESIATKRIVAGEINVPDYLYPLYDYANKPKPVELSRRPCTAAELGSLITQTEYFLGNRHEEDSEVAAKRARRVSNFSNGLMYGVVSVVLVAIGIEVVSDKELHMHPVFGAIMIAMGGVSAWLGIRETKKGSTAATKKAFETTEKSNAEIANLRSLSELARNQLELTADSE